MGLQTTPVAGRASGAFSKEKARPSGLNALREEGVAAGASGFYGNAASTAPTLRPGSVPTRVEFVGGDAGESAVPAAAAAAAAAAALEAGVGQRTGLKRRRRARPAVHRPSTRRDDARFSPTG
ncbi:hypothetical protein KM043_000931 [Ampulex compressa]|nr:hypothetical protein KM043_000931 [Ampulex compressa]